MRWKCPTCFNSKNLTVSVVVEAKLTQYPDNFETEAEGDHIWDGDSLMTCPSCIYCGASREFEDNDHENH